MKQKLRKDCDKLWVAIVKLRAKGKCQINDCARSGVHAHHIARRSGNVRWFVANGIYLCKFHHDHDFEGWMDWEIIVAIGREKFEELQDLARQIKQWREPDLKELKADLESILAYYEEEKS